MKERWIRFANSSKGFKLKSNNMALRLKLCSVKKMTLINRRIECLETRLASCSLILIKLIVKEEEIKIKSISLWKKTEDLEAPLMTDLKILRHKMSS